MPSLFFILSFWYPWDMKLILSPTKTMVLPGAEHPLTTPAFDAEAADLILKLQALDMNGLAALFKTSEALTQKTREQIASFGETSRGPAIFSFRGDAFKSLGAEDFSPSDLAFAQRHLAIFSGLYGVLSPFDGIRPYRLDFNTPLKVDGGSLKAFWKKRLVPWFQNFLAPGEPLLDLASREYSSILDFPGMIHFQFREGRGHDLKNVSVRAKQARGAFARYIIQQNLASPDVLKDVSLDGYEYDSGLSSPGEWFFTRG